MKGRDLAFLVCMTLSGLGMSQAVGAEIYNQSQNNYSQSAKPQENYKVNDFSKDSDAVLMARMLYGEARNCSKDERIAIAYTAMTRNHDGKKWNGENDLKKVILCPWQYSSFNQNDPNRAKLMDPEKYDAKSWKECLEVAEGVVSGKYENPLPKATHYFNPKAANPKWKDKMTKLQTPKEFKHEFYIEK